MIYKIRSLLTFFPPLLVIYLLYYFEVNSIPLSPLSLGYVCAIAGLVAGGIYPKKKSINYLKEVEYVIVNVIFIQNITRIVRVYNINIVLIKEFIVQNTINIVLEKIFVVQNIINIVLEKNFVVQNFYLVSRIFRRALPEGETYPLYLDYYKAFYIVVTKIGVVTDFKEMCRELEKTFVKDTLFIGERLKFYIEGDKLYKKTLCPKSGWKDGSIAVSSLEPYYTNFKKYYNLKKGDKVPEK